MTTSYWWCPLSSNFTFDVLPFLLFLFSYFHLQISQNKGYRRHAWMANVKMSGCSWKWGEICSVSTFKHKFRNSLQTRVGISLKKGGESYRNEAKINNFTAEFNKTAKIYQQQLHWNWFEKRNLWNISGVKLSKPFAEKAGTSGIRESSCGLNCLKVPACYQTVLMWWISECIHSRRSKHGSWQTDPGERASSTERPPLRL